MAIGVQKIKWTGEGETEPRLFLPNERISIKPDQTVWFTIDQWHDETTEEDKNRSILWTLQEYDTRKIVLKSVLPPSKKFYGINIPKKLCGIYHYYLEANINNLSKSRAAGFAVNGWCDQKLTTYNWSKKETEADLSEIHYGHDLFFTIDTEGMNGKKLDLEIYNKKDETKPVATHVEWCIDGIIELKANTLPLMKAMEDANFYIKVKNTDKEYIKDQNGNENILDFAIKNKFVTPKFETPTNNTPLKVGTPEVNTKNYEKVYDFDMTFALDKEEKTVVPFGIKDFENNIENPFFSFKYSLTKAKIDSLDFQIIDDANNLVYSMTHLKTVIVDVKKKAIVLFEAKKPKQGPLVSKTWDYQEAYKQHALFEPADYTQVGEYFIHWDGFDNEGIYDSTRFNGKTLTAKITAKKDGMSLSKEVKFTTQYSQVQWTDVKVNRNAKRIDVTLRVNLYDGGAKGLECNTFKMDEENSSETFTTNQPDPYKNVTVKTCDWDKIPQIVLGSFNEPIIKERTKTFEQLRDLAIEGLAHYWGRNAKRSKNVILDGVTFEVFVNALNLQDKSKTMDDIPLVYHTNGDWGRSGNPASPVFNTIPDTGIIQQLSYNAGYIHRDWEKDPRGLGGWRYQTEIESYDPLKYDGITQFKETAAHEIGHEILYAYYGNNFSWQHKGSSYYLPQDTKPTEADKPTLNKIAEKIPLAPYIPVVKPLDFMPDSEGEYYPKAPSEIDLMKYYNSHDKNGKFVSGEDLSRTFAAENDVLGLIWLTKIKVK
jgi:hypothetical protein